MKKICYLVLLLFIGCGEESVFQEQSQVKKMSPVKGEPYSYRLDGKDQNDKDCTTGGHSFDDLEGVCNALKNDALNKFCASDKRETLYQNYCLDSQAQLKE